MLWTAMVGLIVVLAVYVSFGRLLMSNVGEFRAEILAEVNARVPFTVDATAVSGHWESFTPELVFDQLTLSHPDLADVPVVLREGRLAIDVWNSLVTRSLQLTRVHLDGLDLAAEMSEDGRLTLKGFGREGSDLGPWAESFILNVQQLSLTNVDLALDVAGRERRRLLLDLNLLREGSRRWLEADLHDEEGNHVAVAARGVGNPFKPRQFSGGMYLDFDLLQLEQLRTLLPPAAPGAGLEASGELALEVWLGWDRGQPSMEASFAAAGLALNIPGIDWRLELDELSAATSLIKRDQHWLLFAQDLSLRQGDVKLGVGRLQVDGWGDSVRLRAQSLPLDGSAEILRGVGAIPGKLRDVLLALQPAGWLDSVELLLADVAEPAKQWQLAANFDRLTLASWRGTPAVQGGRGHLELGERGGVVNLDSQDFSMHFPTVYREPLEYDDIYGAIAIDWDEYGVTLSSGPITASAEEGTARALFGLNIPAEKTPAGIEMELLVGLRDTVPYYRTKYLPYVLPTSLSDWLATGIDQGHIEEGAFLWRGSLRPHQADLRTVQLFFNLDHARVKFHPDWPGVRVESGILLIDDREVSVWADHAGLYAARAESVSVEAWPDETGQMHLALQGQVRGDAADGLRVVNESPLSTLVGNAFATWSATGELEADLFLELLLTGGGVPRQIEVATRWRGVEIGITPLRLQVGSVSGDLNYSARHGFSSSGLTGRLWDRQLGGRVSQVTAAGAGSGQGLVLVAIRGTVAMQSVRDWLALEPLALAEGETEVAADILLVRGEAPRLAVTSTLDGVSLDLPAPWGKPATGARQFRLDTAMGTEPGLLHLALDEQLYLDIGHQRGGFVGAALGFGQAPSELLPGWLRIDGTVDRIDIDQSLEFVERYFSARSAGESADGAAQEYSGPSLRIDRVLAREARLLGREWHDVELELVEDFGAWSARLATPWLRGTLELPGRDLPGEVEVSFLDLSGLTSDPDHNDNADKEPGAPGPGVSSPGVSSPGGSSPPELPQLVVRIDGIQRDSTPLGHLAFDLQSTPGELRVDNLSGTLAGLSVDSGRPAFITWQAGETGAISKLQLGLEFRDLGDTLADLSYERILETDAGRADLDLEWAGSPARFALARLAGSLVLDVERGSYRTVPEGTSGALRVVSILNLTDIVSRLSLTQMFESGVPFHSMDGEVFFHRGTIEADEIRVLGSSSAFHFTGLADVERESLNGELVVTLPVANNLPWIAALAGGLPAAAGMFVVSKLFEDQFARLSSAVYKIAGSWNNPEVTFDRIFDDATAVALDVNPAESGGAGKDRAPGGASGEAGEAGREVSEGPVTDAPNPIPAIDAGT